MTNEEKKRLDKILECQPHPNELIEAVQSRQVRLFERALKKQFEKRESKAQFEKRRAANKAEIQGLCDIVDAIEGSWKNEIASL